MILNRFPQIYGEDGTSIQVCPGQYHLPTALNVHWLRQAGQLSSLAEYARLADALLGNKPARARYQLIELHVNCVAMFNGGGDVVWDDDP